MVTTYQTTQKIQNTIVHILGFLCQMIHIHEQSYDWCYIVWILRALLINQLKRKQNKIIIP
jgi:hypothetical protein